MPRKISTIKLNHFKQADQTDRLMHSKWRVVQVGDSLDYNPGDVLNEATVKELCVSRDWKVSIT
jgi:hypothetical protein